MSKMLPNSLQGRLNNSTKSVNRDNRIKNIFSSKNISNSFYFSIGTFQKFMYGLIVVLLVAFVFRLIFVQGSVPKTMEVFNFITSFDNIEGLEKLQAFQLAEWNTDSAILNPLATFWNIVVIGVTNIVLGVLTFVFSGLIICLRFICRLISFFTGLPIAF